MKKYYIDDSNFKYDYNYPFEKKDLIVYEGKLESDDDYVFTYVIKGKRYPFFILYTKNDLQPLNLELKYLIVGITNSHLYLLDLLTQTIINHPIQNNYISLYGMFFMGGESKQFNKKLVSEVYIIQEIDGRIIRKKSAFNKIPNATYIENNPALFNSLLEYHKQVKLINIFNLALNKKGKPINNTLYDDFKKKVPLIEGKDRNINLLIKIKYGDSSHPSIYAYLIRYFLSILPNTCYISIGRSGTGKTALLKTLTRLVETRLYIYNDKGEQNKIHVEKTFPDSHASTRGLTIAYFPKYNSYYLDLPGSEDKTIMNSIMNIIKNTISGFNKTFDFPDFIYNLYYDYFHNTEGSFINRYIKKAENICIISMDNLSVTIEDFLIKKYNKKINLIEDPMIWYNISQYNCFSYLNYKATGCKSLFHTKTLRDDVSYDFPLYNIVKDIEIGDDVKTIFSIPKLDIREVQTSIDKKEYNINLKYVDLIDVEYDIKGVGYYYDFNEYYYHDFYYIVKNKLMKTNLRDDKFFNNNEFYKYFLPYINENTKFKIRFNFILFFYYVQFLYKDKQMVLIKGISSKITDLLRNRIDRSTSLDECKFYNSSREVVQSNANIYITKEVNMKIEDDKGKFVDYDFFANASTIDNIKIISLITRYVQDPDNPYSKNNYVIKNLGNNMNDIMIDSGKNIYDNRFDYSKIKGFENNEGTCFYNSFFYYIYKLPFLKNSKNKKLLDLFKFFDTNRNRNYPAYIEFKTDNNPSKNTFKGALEYVTNKFGQNPDKIINYELTYRFMASKIVQNKPSVTPSDADLINNLILNTDDLTLFLKNGYLPFLNKYDIFVDKAKSDLKFETENALMAVTTHINFCSLKDPSYCIDNEKIRPRKFKEKSTTFGLKAIFYDKIKNSKIVTSIYDTELITGSYLRDYISQIPNEKYLVSQYSLYEKTMNDITFEGISKTFGCSGYHIVQLDDNYRLYNSNKYFKYIMNLSYLILSILEAAGHLKGKKSNHDIFNHLLSSLDFRYPVSRIKISPIFDCELDEIEINNELLFKELQFIKFIDHGITFKNKYIYYLKDGYYTPAYEVNYALKELLEYAGIVYEDSFVLTYKVSFKNKLPKLISNNNFMFRELDRILNTKKYSNIPNLFTKKLIEESFYKNISK